MEALHLLANLGLAPLFGLILAAFPAPLLFGVVSLDLGAALVVYVALLRGPRAGAIAGFATGLLSDLSAPALLGRNALLLTILGYLGGILGQRMMKTSTLTQLALVGVTVLLRRTVLLLFSISTGLGSVATALLLYALPTALATAVTATLLFQLIWRLTGRRAC